MQLLREPAAQKMLSEIVAGLSDRAAARLVRRVFNQPAPTFAKKPATG